MESLQSQLSLRSLDVVEGRPSGTGRPSLPRAGDAEVAPGDDGFRTWLERGLGQGASGQRYSIAERIEQRVEAQVMGRVGQIGPRRPGVEGRGEASLDATRLERRAQRAAYRAADRAADRAAEREGAREGELSEREDPSERAVAAHAAGVDQTVRARSEREPAHLGRARSLAAADAAAAEGASSTESGARAARGAPHGALVGTPHGGAVGHAGPLAAAGMRAAGAPAAAAVPGTGSSATSHAAGLPHGAAVAAGRAADAAQAAGPTAPGSAASAPADELELAEQVLRQLRARLTVGQREAVIELRPSELGRIGVRLRFEDGALTATIRAERPETLAVLEAHAPELRAWLAQGGADVRDLDFGLADRDALLGQHDRPHDRTPDRMQDPRREGSAGSRRRESTPEPASAERSVDPHGATTAVDVLV